jgi:hypothetical protein
VNLKFLELKAETDLRWSFQGEAPTFYVPSASYGRHEKVDPFPAYANDMALVRAEAERVAALFPLPATVTFVTLDREFVERTNGFTIPDTDHDSTEKPKAWSATIVLSGKRIPIHPAMTRYLVAHEYGHAVAEHLERTHGVPTDKPNRDYDEERLYQEYRALRGMDADPKSYGGGWHATVSELFANDFRILVAKSEIEFWPHPGFLRPEELVKVVEFWKREVDALKVCESQNGENG